MPTAKPALVHMAAGKETGIYTGFTCRLQSLILHPFKALKVQTATSKGCHIYKDKTNCGSCVLAVSALGSFSSRASILLSYSNFAHRNSILTALFTDEVIKVKLYEQHILGKMLV